MGRIILADESVQRYIQKLIVDGQWNIGLVIGQQGQADGSQRDYVVHVTRTPEPMEDAADIESDLDVVSEILAEKKESEKSIPRPESLESANEVWICTHAKQVTKMLPGGMFVIGIFAVAPPKMMEGAQAKLRQLLYSVHRAVNKGKILQANGQKMIDRVLLQICSQTRKLTCRTLDVNYHLSSFRPAEWKYQSILERFLRLETRVAVSLSLRVPTDTAKQNLSKQIKTCIAPYCENIWESLATVNKQLRNMDQTLEFSDSKKGRLTRGAASHNKYIIDLFLSATSDKKVTTGAKLSECGAKMHIQGVIAGRAFVHNKSTVREGIEAVKEDVVRSLSSRCQLLCEDINVVEDDREENMHELYDTPKRIFANISGFPITFCDYAFKDETEKDIIERYSELLDMTPEGANLELDAETFFDEEGRDNMLKLVERTSAEGQLSSTTEQKDKKRLKPTKSASHILGNLRAVGVMASGAVVAAIVAGMSYLYLGDENSLIG